MRLRRRGLWLLAGLCVRVGGSAQAPVQPVQWTVAITQKTAMKPGTSSVIELSAEVEEGWHVYGLMQLPDPRLYASHLIRMRLPRLRVRRLAILP